MKKFLNNLNDRSLNYGQEALKDWAKRIKAECILDIGAGKGRDLDVFSSSLKGKESELIAIESYQPSVEILESKNIRVYNLDLEKEEFPLDNDSVDLIIANQILEHCKEIFWIHHQIFRTLKVGGI